jgi:hypothetical protein
MKHLFQRQYAKDTVELSLPMRNIAVAPGDGRGEPT